MHSRIRAAGYVLVGLLGGCTTEGSGASYPSADLVRFNGATLAEGSYDPREGDTVVQAPTDAGHDWGLAVGEGVVLTGVPELGEVRAFALDGSDDDEGTLVAQGGAHEGFGASLAARGATVYVGVPDAASGPEGAGAGAVERLDEEGERVTGGEAQGHFGSVLAACGDLHGDGSPDLLVTAPWEGELAGRVYELSDGAPASDTESLASLAGGAPNLGFGGALACSADVVEDDAPDVVIGAPFAKGGGGVVGEGEVTLWGAAALLAGEPATTLHAHEAGSASAGLPESFGSSVAACRLRATGKADLVVGAPGAFDGEGAAYLFTSEAGLVSGAPVALTLRGGSSEARFGSTVVCADVTGDGLDELFVGAPGQDAPDGSVEVGAVYGFAAPAESTGTMTAAHADWIFSADRAFLRAGRSFVAGDLDGDGRAELVLLVRQPVRASELEE